MEPKCKDWQGVCYMKANGRKPHEGKLLKLPAELEHQGDLGDSDIETACMSQLLCSVWSWNSWRTVIQWGQWQRERTEVQYWTVSLGETLRLWLLEQSEKDWIRTEPAPMAGTRLFMGLGVKQKERKGGVSGKFVSETVVEERVSVNITELGSVSCPSVWGNLFPEFMNIKLCHVITLMGLPKLSP